MGWEIDQLTTWAEILEPPQFLAVKHLSCCVHWYGEERIAGSRSHEPVYVVQIINRTSILVQFWYYSCPLNITVYTRLKQLTSHADVMSLMFKTLEDDLQMTVTLLPGQQASEFLST